MNCIEEIEVSHSQITVRRADWSFLEASLGVAGIAALLAK